MDSQRQDSQNEKIVENKELNIWEALIPIFALVGMLAFNVFVFGYSISVSVRSMVTIWV